MINRQHYGILVFESSSAASQAEIKMTEKNWSCRLIPIPEQLSAGCGLVLQLSVGDLKEIKTFITKEAISCDGIYEVKVSKERKKTVSPWKQ
ncbi:Protein of unknown function [Carnobacterium iners]|uniref:Putative Se/S carrier protein-like domain-containing protein n=1 Tax=Carnobacterium iners TaxID=1073423 RepID=A0A1X7MVN9_9LACT|nr:DUF3343 domain-containing protein [Carnobacterium iners]SEL26667.1 Protein of unknown function [Carnobacterium iners]SMH28934.1 Protein of unknown function [Carnobacterium iners]